jgi:hypothetical protein
MLDEDIKLSAQGLPQWFSPKHAGEKFKEMCIELAMLAADSTSTATIPPNGYIRRGWRPPDYTTGKAPSAVLGKIGNHLTGMPYWIDVPEIRQRRASKLP